MFGCLRHGAQNNSMHSEIWTIMLKTKDIKTKMEKYVDFMLDEFKYVCWVY
jgi:hypothetical protein